MNWIQEELNKINETHEANSSIVLFPEDEDVKVLIDISHAPKEDLRDTAGGMKMYRQFLCLDKEHEGKILSATPFLYNVIMRKLDKYEDANAITAHLIITGKKVNGKQDWNVVVLEVK